jgi:heme-degrading monooxygenase HmoA
MTALLVLAEFVFSPEGEAEFQSHIERTLAECRAVEGCLHAVVWHRPERRYQFSTLWRDRDAVNRWVDNDFHRRTLMPGFRQWCTEGWFGEFLLDVDHRRARRCPACQRWTQGEPGWVETEPLACRHCGGELKPSAD